MPMTDTPHRTALRKLTEAGLLAPYAWHFANTVMRLQPLAQHALGPPSASDPAHETLFLAAALCAHQTLVAQHVCLELRLAPETRVLSDLLAPSPTYRPASGSPSEADAALSAAMALPLPGDWQERLADPACAFAIARADAPERDRSPLVLESSRLYLQRYWRYERTLADWLIRRVAADAPAGDATAGLAALTRPLTGITLDPDQLQALHTALTRRICVITGGPGTGKTTLIALLLAGLLEHEPDLRITLCAPTGKAQARMQQALRSQLEQHLTLPPAVRRRLLDLVPATLHRALGYQPAHNRFTYHLSRPLPTDLLILDEASMAPLPLLCKLLDALPPQARLLLLGDPDQLAAVETGAAFGDICQAWSDRTNLCQLRQSHRFDNDQGIGRLRIEINRGDAANAWRRVCDDSSGTLCRRPTPDSDNALRAALDALLQTPALSAFVHYPEAGSFGEAVAAFDGFRVLCATRHGPTGLYNLNAILRERLGITPYGRGYPLMITTNDYNLKLFNGDIGLCWPDPSAPAPGDRNASPVPVVFPDPAEPGAFRVFSRAQLPEHEAAFAMTVHKAQGSGYDRLLLVLPRRKSPVLTREWLYTGLTRARLQVYLWTDEAVFKYAISHPTRRPSGLADKLTPAQNGTYLRPS